MPVSSAWAGTNGFVVPIFRGQPGSEFAGWERFTFGSGTNNTPDIAGSTTNAGLLQLDPAAFVTGSGNIYNLSGASRFRIRYQQPFPLNTVVLQARTLGAELDYASVRLVFESNGTNVSLSADRIELDRGTAQGVNVSSKWEWNLSGHSATVFTIEFDAAGPSLSFDSATLDVSRKTFRIASARSAVSGDDANGFYQVTPPCLTTRRWASAWTPAQSPKAWGFVAPRYEKRAVAAMMDGHAQTLGSL